MEKARPFLEKYNSEFKIDSSEWYKVNKLTNIYVKAEIDSSNHITMFETTYDRGASKFNFKRKKSQINFTFNSTPFLEII